MESLGEHPISGEPLGRVNITAFAVVAVNGEDEGQSTTTIERAPHFPWNKPTLLVGVVLCYRSISGTGVGWSGKVMSAVADQGEEEELNKARRGCCATIDCGVDTNSCDTLTSGRRKSNA